MILQRTVDTYTGYYDFAVTGGAVGSYDLQVPIPVHTCITEFVVIVKQGFTSAANLATISFDVIVTDVIPNITVVGRFMFPTVAFGLIPTYSDFYWGSLINTPITNAKTVSVGFSIGVEDLLTGQMQFLARGTSFDF
jgi:hypothetical protein